MYVYKKTCLISDDELLKYITQLEPEMARVETTIQKQDFSTPYAWVNLPTFYEYHASCKKLIEEKKALGIDVLLLIGIGGSDAGARALYQAIHGVMGNADFKNNILLYCADTIDSGYTQELVTLVEGFLQAGKKVLINIVSKSGSTTETVINAAIFYDLLAQYRPNDARELVVVTTDEHSPLAACARHNNFSLLIVPTHVGGRYSVFSAVGLFPLGMLGIDIDAILQGAAAENNLCTQVSFDNKAAVRAALLYAHYARGIVIHDLFIFNPAWTLLGAWYRQLMAESLGKAGQGILPTVSLGTVDLHSVAQLYLGGQKNRFTTFLMSKNNISSMTIARNAFSNGIQAGGLALGTVQESIIYGVTQAYYKEHCAYMTIALQNQSLYELGVYMQSSMLEIVYLAYLMGVNPFDQPQVELYKREARAFLAL
ncbi:MAG: hypothetical protein WC707_04220 [Candidatus Babeliaceae bacterium]|jgi:glucose-6-phosphate isomerase